MPARSAKTVDSRITPTPTFPSRSFSIRPAPNTTDAPADARGAERNATHEILAALEHAPGHIVVTSDDGRAARYAVGCALRQVAAFRSVRFPGHAARPAEVVDALIAPRTAGVSARSKPVRRHELLALLEQAQSAGRPILVVVDEADRVSIRRLERLRSALECLPEATSIVRMLLVGTPRLLDKLERRTSRSLAERITARIDAGADPAVDRCLETVVSRQATRDRKLARIALAAAAACVVYGLVMSVSSPTTRSLAMRTGVTETAAPAAGRAASEAAAARSGRPDRVDAAARVDAMAATTRPRSAERVDAVAAVVAQLAARPAPHRRDNEPVTPTVGRKWLTPVSALAAPPTTALPTKSRATKQVESAPATPPKAAVPTAKPPTPTVVAALQPPETVADERQPAADGDGGARQAPQAATLTDGAAAATVVEPVRTYTLQIASMRSRERAVALSERLGARFDDVYLVAFEHAGVSYHRVRVGRFSSAAAAAETEARLRKEGYEPLRFRVQAAP